jgi:catechol 2,3-dioxygenase-like lactoylglutathione lyase family enzyme
MSKTLVKGPGPKDILVFEKSESNIGVIDKVVQEVVKAGGTIWKQGEFGPTEPFVFFTDIDGYSIEIWYED